MIQALAPRRYRAGWWLQAFLLLLASFSLVLGTTAAAYANGSPAPGDNSGVQCADVGFGGTKIEVSSFPFSRTVPGVGTFSVADEDAALVFTPAEGVQSADICVKGGTQLPRTVDDSTGGRVAGPVSNFTYGDVTLVPVVEQATAVAPTSTPATCLAPGSYTLPADTDQVTYELVQGQLRADGTFLSGTVVATPADGFVLSNGGVAGNGTLTFTLEPIAQLTGEQCDQEIVAAGPDRVPATCTDGSAYELTLVEGVVYSVDGLVVDGDAGDVVTITTGSLLTATAAGGYSLTGDTSWPLTFTGADEDLCPLVQRVTLCHATGSASNPYVIITVDTSAITKRGHDVHQDGTDIIPPFSYVEDGETKQYDGLNWPAGQAIFDNGCVVTVPAQPAVETAETCEDGSFFTVQPTDGVQYVFTPAGGTARDVAAGTKIMQDGTLTARAVTGELEDPAFSQDIVITPALDCVVDLGIDKTDLDATAVRGGQVVYTLTVTNAGNQPVSEFTVTDTMETGLSLQSVVGDGFVCAPALAFATCDYTGEVLQPGQTRQLMVTASVADDAPATVVNLTEVSTGGDSNPANDTDRETTPVVVTPVTDLSITKTDGGASAVRGGTVTYTLQVTNVGNQGVSGFTVAEQPEAGLTITSITGGTGFTCTTTSCSYSGAALLPGQARQLTVVASVAADAPSTLVNVVVVDAPGDTNETNDRDTEDTPVTTPPVRDLRIVKVDDVAASVEPGDTFGYTLTVFNDGDRGETGFVVTDTLPEGLSLVGTPTGTGFACEGLVCTYTGPAVPVGGSVALTLTVLLAETFEGTSVLNTATVPLTGDPTPGNNTDTETTPVTSVLPEPPLVRDLSIVKRDAVTTVKPGEDLAYSLVVTNRGNAGVSGFTVTDALPAGLALVSVSGNGFTCSGTTSVSCTFAGTLAPGATATITLVGRVAADFEGNTVVNTAVVPLEGDPTPGNNTDTETTPVVEVLPTVLAPPVTATPPAAVTPPPARPTVVPTALPFTGSDTDAVALSALALVLLGAGAVVAGRRRPSGKHAA